MMTKQLREKLIPRRTSLLPRISSSYDGNHIEVVDTANGNNGKNNIKWIEYICKFIHVLSTIIQFCSPVVIIVALLSYDSVIVIAVAFGLCLLKILVLDLYLFKMGKIQNWPNKIDTIAATVIVSFVISDVMISRTNNQFRIVLNIVINGVLTAYNGVAWLLFGYPLGQIFVSDKVEDTVPFTHPVVIHFIQLTSRVMLCTFFLNFMLSIAAKVYYDHGEKETASAFSSFGLFLIVGMILFNWCYGFYFKTNIAKIAAKYEKEISKQMDSKYHPNNNHNEKSTTKLEMQAIIIHNTNTV